MRSHLVYEFEEGDQRCGKWDDGVTTWHPAFLALGKSLEECAVKYKGFCQKYRVQEKPVKKNRWGSKLLAGMKPDKKGKRPPPGQLRLFVNGVILG